jgi:N-acetylglucosamine-6-phosphate deacetylase
VYDAIPHNGALMRDAGVVVSFNSDSNELARRLNTEAAKAVRYGDVPPAEALQFVTLNPARQLGIADRVGSLEPGKDADFVVWSTDPLSTFAVCEQTWIEGRAMFTRERDAALRARNAAERQRILQKLLAQKPRKKAGPEPAEAAADHAPRDPKLVAAELVQALAAELRRSAAGQRGDCGCEEGFDGR